MRTLCVFLRARSSCRFDQMLLRSRQHQAFERSFTNRSNCVLPSVLGVVRHNRSPKVLRAPRHQFRYVVRCQVRQPLGYPRRYGQHPRPHPGIVGGPLPLNDAGIEQRHVSSARLSARNQGPPRFEGAFTVNVDAPKGTTVKAQGDLLSPVRMNRPRQMNPAFDQE
jgi:hypothetical protein